MLSTNEFVVALEIMSNSLPTPGMSKRIEGLYYFFKNEEYDTIAKAAEEGAARLDKFPTPAVFKEIVKKHRPKKAGRQAECEFCGGIGVVLAMRKGEPYNFAFRCHCANSASYNAVPVWTSAHRRVYDLLDGGNIFQHLHDYPELYRAGITHMMENKVFTPAETRSKILKRLEQAEKPKNNEAPF